MKKFFLVNNLELIELIDAPTKLRVAARLSAAGALATLIMVIGGLSSVIGIFSFIGLIRSLLTPDVASGEISFFFWSFVSMFVLSVVLIAAYRWFVSIENARFNLLEGKHRKYFVSSKHASFGLMMTPFVRSELTADSSGAKFAAAQMLFSEPSVIDADKVLLRDYDHYVKMSEAESTLLDMIERFSEVQFGSAQSGYFQDERSKLATSLSRDLEKHEQRAFRGRELLSKITR